METKLLELFEGDSTQHLEVTLTGGLDERGKKQAKYTTVREPVTAELWKKHLDGEVIIGIKPEIDGKTKWGCIDMDPSNYKDFNEKKFVDIIKQYSLPLVPLKSKSGGLHLILFLTDWADQKKVREELDKWNEKYFLAKEVFPRNKHLGMPYHKATRTVEYAYDDRGEGLDLEQFIELAFKRRISFDDLINFKTKKYEPEPDWNEYPPCVQSLLTDKWNGEHRNDIMFNMAVLEMKRSDGNVDKKTLVKTLFERNQAIFSNPLTEKEIMGSVAQSTAKKSYNYKCPPRYPHMTPICNKQLCQMRKLGIGCQVPDIIDEFTNVIVTRNVKETFMEFKYKDKPIVIKTDDDLIDEKSFRKKLLTYSINWMTLPKPKRGPNPFEMLVQGLFDKADENKDAKFEDTLADTAFTFKKKFFETHMIVKDFEELKHGYLAEEVENEKVFIFFKKSTLDEFIKKSSLKLFANSQEALQAINAIKVDYHKLQKNLWKMELPDFKNKKQPTKQETQQGKLTELDDEYHAQQFRAPK